MNDAPDPDNAAGFHSSVDDVFGRIASRYDLLSDLFSFGIHRLWKRRVATLIAQESWTTLLDAAAGTGDVIVQVARNQRVRPPQMIIASDISPQMLAIARQRAAGLDPVLEFQVLDAHAMPSIPDSSVDLYSISLALKICDRTRVFREAMRVLRPGGRLISLEASSVSPGWLHRLYLRYMSICMPIIGWLATVGDASAYRYLLKGIQDFPTAEELANELSCMGFLDVSFERLSLGVVAIHVARKAPSSTDHADRR